MDFLLAKILSLVIYSHTLNFLGTIYIYISDKYDKLFFIRKDSHFIYISIK